jgi:ArsR family transcriptional regulator, cadmium/lead-responsive transcriptional repressor
MQRSVYSEPMPSVTSRLVAQPEGRQHRYELADPHLSAALETLLSVTLAVDESAECLDPACPIPGCCEAPA